MYSHSFRTRQLPGRAQDCAYGGGAELFTVEEPEASPLIRAFKRAHKDVVERLSGVDFAPMSAGEANAKWESVERDILLQTNQKHDWEHRNSPWFRLYYDYF